MERRSIAFSPPDITELEIQEVAEALRSGWITTGPRTKKLEKELAEYCHTNKVVCLNSATAAEELNLQILGIGEGDEVLVPAYTYTASASAAIHCGATVKFIDSQKDSVEMNYDAMEAAITEKQRLLSPWILEEFHVTMTGYSGPWSERKHFFTQQTRSRKQSAMSLLLLTQPMRSVLSGMEKSRRDC